MPRVTVGVLCTAHMDLVLSTNEGMLNAMMHCMEVHRMFDNGEMTNFCAG